MGKNNQKKSIKNIGLVVVIIVIIGATALYVFKNSFLSVSNSENLTQTLAVNKYSSSLKRLKKTLNSLDPELFKHEIFLKLKSFISLPLEVGLTGKENPFESPPEPVDLLLEQKQ